MDLSIRMRVMYSVTCRYAIRLKFKDKLLTSPIKSVLEAKAKIFFTVKENLLFNCSKFLAFVVVVII